MSVSLSPIFNGWQGFSIAGVPLAGGLLSTYLAGTSTPAATYIDSSGGATNANPIQLDGAGLPPNEIWITDGVAYKFTLTDALGLNPRTFDNISNAAGALSVALANTGSVSNGDALVGVKTTATGATATTQHQVNEEDASVFRFLSSAQITAVAAETGASGAVCATALQAALDGARAGANLGLNRYPVGTYQLDVPLRWKSGTPRMTIRGDNRIRCIVQPNAVDIKVAPMSVNALFINQDNNPHCCIENLRMTSTVGFTGVGIYSVEGGGSDATGQCIFSGIFRNLWVDFASTNTGFLTGATQNTIFDSITFENMKGCFTLTGVGNGDNFYSNHSLYGCYDQHILQTADTNGMFAGSVESIHAYNHQRGRLYDIQNWTGGVFNDITIESKTGATGADTIGFGRFKNCTGLLVSNVYGMTRTGVPALTTGIEIEGGSGKFVNVKLNAATGLTINGTAAIDHEFVSCDFTTSSNSCAVIAAALTGTLRTRGCKFNDATIRGIVNSVAGGSFSWYSYGDEFINAGLGGNAASRNIDINTTGTVKLYNPRIGQNNVSAAAGYYISANGAGTLDIYDPEWIGTPPSGLVDPAGTMVVTIHKSFAVGNVDIAAATYTVLESDRDLTANFAGTCTLTLPTPAAANAGRRLNVRTITANTVVSASSNVAPITSGIAGTAMLAATAGKWCEIVSNGTLWKTIAAG